MKLYIWTATMVLMLSTNAQSLEALEIVPRDLKSRPLDIKNFKFISDRLYLDKLADYLDCEVRVTETKKERRFSTGIKSVEMLEIRMTSKRFRSDEHVAYFTLGSSLTTQSKNSNLAGVVEEFKLESDDLYNTQFIFQHDGRGRITWMNYVSDITTLACGIKK